MIPPPHSSPAAWWQIFIDSIDRLPVPQQAGRLAGLAIKMAERGERQAASIIALRAWRQNRAMGNGLDNEIIRHALTAVTPRYHLQISTDGERIAAWDAAIAAVVRPGMLALEIGAGSGILAMLAARAGANVVTCENDQILAAFAEDIIQRNGFRGRIKVVASAAHDLRVREDLPRPADLLILDLFADELFSFTPFEVIRSARRLLQPGAIAIPLRVSLEGALAYFRRWHREMPDRIAGIDVSTLRDLASMRTSLDAADSDIVLRSAAESMVSATLPDDLPAPSGVSDRNLISRGGPVNGVAVWLRLELAAGCVLEARPGRAPRGFYAKPRFFAFREMFETRPQQTCSVRFKWNDKRIDVTLIECRN